MADKGYQGAHELGRYIIPNKGSSLTNQEKASNNNIAKARIIIQNFYGRMKKLFKILVEAFRLDEDCFDDIFVICFYLTNYHIQNSPLRKEDGEYHRAVLKKWWVEEDERREKIKTANEAYIARKKRRHLADRSYDQTIMDD